MSISRISLYHLETLLWIDRLGTFSAAAERLNTTQPAVSARMRKVTRTLRGADTQASYSGARGAFAGIAAQIGAGDISALANVQQAGDAFLTASRANASTLAQYKHDRALVTGTVGAAIGLASSQVTSATDQLSALNASVQGLLEARSAL